MNTRKELNKKLKKLGLKPTTNKEMKELFAKGTGYKDCGAKRVLEVKNYLSVLKDTGE
jgi:hypothetical protein